MRAAWAAAARLERYDYFLWINDDVVLDDGAMERAVGLAMRWESERTEVGVFVGALRDPVSGHVTYGGVRRPSRLRALYFERVVSEGEPEPVETCNGNFLIVPRKVMERVGMIDPVFVHALGDYDYGFRVARAGFLVLALPGTVGTCPRNPEIERTRVLSMTLGERWKRMLGPKHYPLRPWLVYAWRHTGWLWPLFFLRPYVEALWPRIFTRLL